jgi:hypothetical protein
MVTYRRARLLSDCELGCEVGALPSCDPSKAGLAGAERSGEDKLDEGWRCGWGLKLLDRPRRCVGVRKELASPTTVDLLVDGEHS